MKSHHLKRGVKKLNIRKLVLAAVLIMAVSMAWMVQTPVHANASELYLTKSLLTQGEDVYFDHWSSSSFEDISGEVFTKGIGFSPYYGSTYNMRATFNIQDYNYTTLETRAGLQNGYNTGDRGKTELLIYADDKKIYGKTFANTTPPQDLKLPIPTGTKNITFYTVMTKGPQGGHRALFGNARLTNALPASAKQDMLALDNIGSSSAEDSYYRDWNSIPFEMADGHLAGRGYGLKPYYSSTNKIFTQFKITDYDYSTLETRVSLDKKWTTGDKGKTEVSIYADNVKLYSKTFTNKTAAQNVKLRLPKKTDYLTIYALQHKGAQGNHAVIIENPVLTKSLDPVSEDDTIALDNLGMSENDNGYIGKWGSEAFQMAEGNLVARGFGLKPYYSSDYETFAKVYVADYAYPTLETKISLDNKWRTGDRGKTTLFIYADNKVIYKKTFDNKSKSSRVIASIPSRTKYITFKASHSKGGAGHGVILEHPLLTYRPHPPSVNPVNNKTTKITGKAKANSTVTLKIGSKTIKTAKTTSKGAFSMSISAQKAGTTLALNVKDSKGRVSATKYIKVTQKK